MKSRPALIVSLSWTLAILIAIVALYLMSNLVDRKCQVMDNLAQKAKSQDPSSCIIHADDLNSALMDQDFALKHRLVWVFSLSLLIIITLLLTGVYVNNRSWKRLIIEMEKGLNEFEAGNFAVRIDSDKYEDNAHLVRVTQRINNLVEMFDHLQKKIQKHYKTELEKADRLASVGELAASMAHEIKNPVAGIANAMQVLTAELQPEDERVPIFLEIQNQAHRVNRAINNLLSYARPAEPELVEGNLNDPLNSSLVLMEGQIKERKIKLETLLDSDIPYVKFDRQQMQQVLVNILLNAIQAMPDGGTLTVQTGHDLERIFVKVRDTGKGIPDNILPGIFIPFYTTKHKGTGLGLAISRSIVNNHGGEIDVRTKEDQGTEFEVYLPIHVENN